MDENGYNDTVPRLPHHRLRCFGVAQELVVAVRAAGIRDAHLRDQALRAAKSAMLNVGEGAGRVSPADKARAFAIARGEAVEACAAVETAAVCGDAPAGAAAEVVRLTEKLYAMLTPLARAR
jgi:four helix bundle protein